MAQSAQNDGRPDSEMADIISRFEELYAATGPEEAAVVAEPQPSAVFADNEFELPVRSETGTEPARMQEPVMAAGSAREPAPEPRIDPRASNDDVEEAFAILRGVEPKLTRQPARDLEDKEDEPPAQPVQAERSRALRRYAVPALAATLFVGLATGYVVTRHNEAPASPAAAAPSAPLRMDYSLQQPAKRDAVTTPAAPAR